MGKPCGGTTILAIFYRALHPTAPAGDSPDLYSSIARGNMTRSYICFVFDRW